MMSTTETELKNPFIPQNKFYSSAFIKIEITPTTQDLLKKLEKEKE